MRLNVDRDCLDDRRRLLAQFDGLRAQLDTSGALAGMERIQSQAFDVILRGAADAFDLSRESPETIARYDTAGLAPPIKKTYSSSNYLDHGKTLGRQLLLARRLCERGCGFVMVNTGFVWDMQPLPGPTQEEEGMGYVARCSTMP